MTVEIPLTKKPLNDCTSILFELHQPCVIDVEQPERCLSFHTTLLSPSCDGHSLPVDLPRRNEELRAERGSREQVLWGRVYEPLIKRSTK